MTRRRTTPTPGQMTLDAALLTVILPTGRTLVLLQGGRADPSPAPTPAPVVALAQHRRAA
jgi:hypothetical protein